MPELSELDKKIIYELGKDARQTHRKLAQTLHSKKETIAYHIKNLTEQNIITKFVPVISLTKLGISSAKIYVKIKGIADDNIIKTLVESKDICWVATSIGQWDLMVGFYYTDMIEFGKKKQFILTILNKYIESYDIVLNEDALVFNRDYLIQKGIEYRKQFIFHGQAAPTEISESDKQLLSLIRNNGRFEAREIAKALNLDARTVINRIKQLEKQEIIQGYTVFLDLQKINAQLHKMCITLANHDSKELSKLISYLKTEPRTLHIIKTVAPWELEVEMEMESMPQLFEYIKKIKSNFPNTIKSINTVTIERELKLEFFPAIQQI